jgi:Holliday junction resolvasome RuvABC endonuclease subunit
MSGSMKPHKTVIAFDPGLTDTGVAVVRGDALLFSGTIRPKGEGPAERLGDLMEKTENLFEAYGPDRCEIEVASHFSYSRSRDAWTGKELNIKDLMKNGYATAVIMAVAGRKNVPTERRDAHTWKLVRGKNMGKEDMKRMACSLFSNLKDKKRLSSHEAEAVCMAFLGQ